MATATPTSRGRPARRTRSRRDLVTAAIFLAPLIVLMVVFVFYPLIDTVRLTFTDYGLISDQGDFVGLQNYAEWVTDPEMWHSLWISVKFFLLYVPVSMVLAFLIAYLIDRLAGKFFPSVYRTIFFFPVVLPAAIVFHMWVNLYDPTYGVFSEVIRSFGGTPPNWLGEPDLALPALAIMSIWRYLGETVILMIVGFANIPRGLYEAARVDGASEFQIVRRVTLPLMVPTLFLIFVLRLKVLELTNEPLFMTEGGPIDSTMTYGLQAYYTFFREDRLGYASTWYILLAIFAVVVAMVAGRRTRQS